MSKLDETRADAIATLQLLAKGHEHWPYGDEGGREPPQLGVAEARTLLSALDERDARIAELEMEVFALTTAITLHNDACESACGIGDQEGVACKYRPYFPRRCSECPKRNWMLVNDAGERIDSALSQETRT